MARLVLLTKTFPWGHAETFLEAELPYLARRFQQVNVHPTLPVCGVRRHIPTRFVADPIAEVSTRAWRAVRSARALVDEAARAWVLADLALAAGFRISGVSRLLLWASEAVRLRNELLSRYPSDGIPTVFYSYWCGPEATALALLRQERKDVRVVTRAHGMDVYEERLSPPYFALRRLTLERLDQVFAVSEHGAVRLQTRSPRENVEVRRLGVVSATRPSPSPSPGDPSLHVVSCATVVPVKRLELLIEALERSQSAIRWTHIGGGPQLASLRHAAERLPRRVSASLLGSLPNLEVRRWFETNPVGLFVNVSEWEGLPIAVAEAMSHGVPILATDAGGTRELVGNGGWLVPVGTDATQVALEIDRIARLSETEREAVGRVAADRVARLLDADRNYRAFADELAALAESAST